MNIIISRIVDHGQQNERVELNVTADCELGEYILADTTYVNEHKISNKLKHMHWFSDKKVIEGDRVVLYTKEGTDTAVKINNGGNTLYTFYWGLRISVWNNDGDIAILLHIDEWMSKKTK